MSPNTQKSNRQSPSVPANTSPARRGTASRVRRLVLGGFVAATVAALPASASADIVEGPLVWGAKFANCKTGKQAPHATSNTGYYRPNDRENQVGEVFYAAVWVIANNNLCPSQYTQIEFTPPTGTRLAISSQWPVKCWSKMPWQPYYQQDTTSCPQSPTVGQALAYAFNPKYQSAWPLPHDGAWQIEIPLQAVSASPSEGTRALGSARTTYGTLNSYVNVKIDPKPQPIDRSRFTIQSEPPPAG